MSSCSLWIPDKTLREVVSYAEARDISRNAAFEELVQIALHGKASVTTTTKQIEEALMEAASKATTAE